MKTLHHAPGEDFIHLNFLLKKSANWTPFPKCPKEAIKLIFLTKKSKQERKRTCQSLSHF